MMKPLVALAVLAPSARAWQFSAEDPSTTYNFLAHGDWGDDSEGQKACAAGMGAVAAEIGATQVISLGDLFYGSGIHTPADGPDGMLRFDKTFEKVYEAPSLKQIPFYAIAGNHDHGGNVSAEIAYTENAQNLQLTGTNKWTGEPLPRTRWTFPDYWHNVTQQFEVQGKRVELEILLFDSVIMVGNTDIYDDAGNQIDELSLSKLNGPPDPASHAKQLAWLEDRMKKSTADYLWLGAHYPVWAIGQDGPTGIRATIRPLLERWNANYFNGHQHDLEHIVEKGSDVNYVSTGAGKFCCYEDSNLDTVPVDSIKFAISGNGAMDWRGLKPAPFEILSGFTSYRIGPDSMKVVYHAHNGTILYSTPPIKPRDRSKLPRPPAPPPAAMCTNETCPATATRPAPPTPTPPSARELPS